ncbi:glutathione-independent formaldehyde dehydrogenase [Caballeronia calidae]|uniref:Glutathione-independent formaldehyde dehydrogenase n=1 Tax=Caballeronia calidae TaxID=1777139 RepID=A0A158CDG0_9BURK|nr:glutathione-independent formaldehyde dehydrogenase [Caballeronia calidae]
MSGNRGVVYVGPGKVEVRSIAFPELVDPANRKSIARSTASASKRADTVTRALRSKRRPRC